MIDLNRDEIFEQVKVNLVELFELEPNDITPKAKLYEELDLDSIDAVDLVVQLQNQTGKKIKPEEFKTVRTVNDVVDALSKLLKE